MRRSLQVTQPVLTFEVLRLGAGRKDIAFASDDADIDYLTHAVVDP